MTTKLSNNSYAQIFLFWLDEELKYFENFIKIRYKTTCLKKPT
jgi:hypothetical protein